MEAPIHSPSLSPKPSPLGETSFYILLALWDEEKHGYAILKDVESISNGTAQLSTSTLYEALSRLLEQDLIERVDGTAPHQPSPRVRKAYRLTNLGRKTLHAESARLQSMLEHAQQRLAGSKA